MESSRQVGSSDASPGAPRRRWGWATALTCLALVSQGAPLGAPVASAQAAEGGTADVGQILRQASGAATAGRAWEALTLLEQLDAQGLGEGQATLLRVRILEDLGAYERARILLGRHLAAVGEDASFDLRQWSNRLTWLNNQASLERDRRASLIKVAMGLIDLDPAQAWGMFQEAAKNLPQLDEASLELLISQTEVLGFTEIAVGLAEKAALLAVTPEARQVARQRVAEVRGHAQQAEIMKAGRVSFPAQELKLGTSRRQWKRNGRRDMDQDERPRHKVRLAPYALGTYEITAQAYRRCQIEGRCPPPRIPVTATHPLQPMTGVSWDGAGAFCASVGGRLPTEAEWEAAARGPDGRTWPWGEAPPTCERAHSKGCTALVGAQSFTQAPAPVGLREAGTTPEGIHDLAGNVAEWVQDGYDPEGYQHLERDDPRGPEHADLRVTRGGSYDRKAFEIRGARREGRVPTRGYQEVGVRCAWDVDASPAALNK